MVPPSRLLSLLGQALRYQLSQGMLPKGDAFDLFSGGRRTQRKEVEEKIPRKQAGLIRFSTESHPETAIFSPDGQSLVTGSVDGFIELWDCDTCKLRKDLDYQMKDELMMHEEVIQVIRKKNKTKEKSRMTDELMIEEEILFIEFDADLRTIARCVQRIIVFMNIGVCYSKQFQNRSIGYACSSPISSRSYTSIKLDSPCNLIFTTILPHHSHIHADILPGCVVLCFFP